MGHAGMSGACSARTFSIDVKGAEGASQHTLIQHARPRRVSFAHLLARCLHGRLSAALGRSTLRVAVRRLLLQQHSEARCAELGGMHAELPPLLLAREGSLARVPLRVALIADPRVLQQLLHRHAVLGLAPEHRPNQLLGLLRGGRVGAVHILAADVLVERHVTHCVLPDALLDDGLCRVAVGVKRMEAREHHERSYAQRPQVTRQGAGGCAVSQHLGSPVCGEMGKRREMTGEDATRREDAARGRGVPRKGSVRSRVQWRACVCTRRRGFLRRASLTCNRADALALRALGSLAREPKID